MSSDGDRTDRELNLERALDADIVREALDFAARMLTGDRDTFDRALAALDRLVNEQEWVKAINAELLPYQERAVRAEAALRDAQTKRDEAQAAVGGTKYLEWSQQWVDQVCHYRNLAIALGAKPEDMLDGYDRHLAETGIEDDTDYTQKNEARETWRDLEAAEARVQQLKAALALWETCYPAHRAECSFLSESGCSCGLQNAREDARAALADL